MDVQTYLFFNGRCDEAVEFYGRTIGAKPGQIFRYKDSPDQSMVTPGWKNKVMHGSLTVGDTEILVSDGHEGSKLHFEGFSLTLRPGAAEAEKIFSALSEGGKVGMPLSKTFFAEKFGMLTDKFGVSWMIIAE
ncbi:MAG: VOC family protein [Opitutaceae bacterium]|jgi:PhnB protein